MKCVPMHHGIPAVLHRDEPWLHRHNENGALYSTLNSQKIIEHSMMEETIRHTNEPICSHNNCMLNLMIAF